MENLLTEEKNVLNCFVFDYLHIDKYVYTRKVPNYKHIK